MTQRYEKGNHQYVIGSRVRKKLPKVAPPKRWKRKSATTFAISWGVMAYCAKAKQKLHK